LDVLCYSARFIPPFAQALSTYGNYAVESLNRLKAIDPACRIPTSIANDLAIRQVADTGDPDLGFKAARAMHVGRAGPLDYAMLSAASLRRAIEVGDRYIRSYSDVLNVRLTVQGSRATLRLCFGLPTPRAIVDFTMTAFYANHIRTPLGDTPFLECWFAHPRPPKTTAYERAFAPATLRFGAQGYGFVFDRDYLDVPLAGSDPALHAVLCEHVASTLRDLDARGTLVAKVREIATSELGHGRPTARSVARRLRMSDRTLSRRLEREGVTFGALLNQTRRDLALRYVTDHDDVAFTEIAFRLGFSHVEAFYRAFRRWTGTTPLTYRRVRSPLAV
jgi:AraC-like DNA-binding protein